MSFFLSITSYSFSQVGFGGVYFGFLSRDFWVEEVFFSKLGFGNGFELFLSKSRVGVFGFASFSQDRFFHLYPHTFHSLFVFAIFSASVSHFLVITRGAVDLSQVDPTHLYPVLLFSNPVPGFTEFLSQLDFLSVPSIGCFFSKVFPNGFLEIVSSVSYLGLLAA